MSRSFQSHNNNNNNTNRSRNRGSFLNSFKKNSSHHHHGSGMNQNGGSSSSSNRNVVVGTEKIAHDALQKNSVTFHYPPLGFVNKIEYTLLYTMMNHPEIYPPSTIYNMIQSEDYIQYIHINTNATTATDSTNSTTDTSYAQLSALLALAAEKWPPPSTTTSSDTTTTTTTAGSAGSSTVRTTTTSAQQRYVDDDEHDDDDDDEYNDSRRRRRRGGTEQRKSESSNNDNNKINIVQALCQILIQCIIRHAERNKLDRETEINELFVPFQKDTINKNNRTAVLSILPAYMGLTATILCGGNPIPFYIGYAVSINQIAQQERELQNYKNVLATTTRMSNIETTNLLHDTDYDYDYNDDNDDHNDDHNSGTKIKAKE